MRRSMQGTPRSDRGGRRESGSRSRGVPPRRDHPLPGAFDPDARQTLILAALWKDVDIVVDSGSQRI